MSEQAVVLAKFKQHREALAELIRAVDAFREEFPAEWMRIRIRCENHATDIGQAMWDGKVCLRENAINGGSLEDGAVNKRTK